MTQLHDLTATEQVEALRTREVSSVELVEHYLDRIDRHDGAITAFLTVLADHARASAAASDASEDRDGLLHGLPLALKDLHPAAGLPTSFGSAALKGVVTPADGPAIANLRAAGAVVIGKTNVCEFGPTCYTDNDIVGPTANPYALHLSPSGSSGGAAAAVAAGLVGVAHGSDGLGSLRTPAANTGLIGFKSSRGRTAGSGAGWLALAAEGPLARTVADAALFLDAMGGPSAADLWRAPEPAPDAFRRAAATAPPRLRVGRLVVPPGGYDVQPDCLTAVDRTLAVLEQDGHEVVDVDTSMLLDSTEVRRALMVVLSASMGQIAEVAIGPDNLHLLMPYTRWLVETNTASATQHAQAQAMLTGAAMRFTQLVQGYDVVVTPTTTAPPLTNAEMRADDGAQCLEVMGRWSAFTPPANLAGLPAVSLPVHHNADGVPIGVQLLGRQFQDELLMSVSARLEEAFDWASVHPPAWSS